MSSSVKRSASTTQASVCKTPLQKQQPISTSTVTKKSISSPLQNYNHKEPFLTPKAKQHEKENCSPEPNGIFDNLQMTPTPMTLHTKLPDNTLYVDYLASLPTPTYKSNVNMPSKTELCPRKLSTEASPEISPRMSNKTFNVGGKNVPQIVISNELDVIQEEGGDKNTAQVSSSLSRSKRDIEFVGTPLRKYSESMRDLNTSKVSSGIKCKITNQYLMNYFR